MFLTQINVSNRRRCTIFTGNRYAITHKMLDARGNMIFIHLIRIVSLQSTNCLHSHLSVHISVFSKTLPHTRPTRITPQIHDRRIRPCHTTGTSLISCNFRTSFGQFPIKSRCHIDTLRKESSILRIRRTMNLI